MKELIEEWDEISKHYKLWEEEVGHGWKAVYEYSCSIVHKGNVYEARGSSPDEAVDNALDELMKSYT